MQNYDLQKIETSIRWNPYLFQKDIERNSSEKLSLFFNCFSVNSVTHSRFIFADNWIKNARHVRISEIGNHIAETIEYKNE